MPSDWASWFGMKMNLRMQSRNKEESPSVSWKWRLLAWFLCAIILVVVAIAFLCFDCFFADAFIGFDAARNTCPHDKLY